jgi:hypothetical protein
LCLQQSDEVLLPSTHTQDLDHGSLPIDHRVSTLKRPEENRERRQIGSAMPGMRMSRQELKRLEDALD